MVSAEKKIRDIGQDKIDFSRPSSVFLLRILGYSVHGHPETKIIVGFIKKKFQDLKSLAIEELPLKEKV